MPTLRSDLVSFSADAARVAANLETAHGQRLDVRRQLAELPISLYWQTKSDADYLGIRQHSSDPGTTVGGARHHAEHGDEREECLSPGLDFGSEAGGIERSNSGGHDAKRRAGPGVLWGNGPIAARSTAFSL